jgi:hypothetical protein
MAQEGADVIAVDICEQIKSTRYPLASPEDLDQTASAVKDLGRRIVALKADVRERDQLRAALYISSFRPEGRVGRMERGRPHGLPPGADRDSSERQVRLRDYHPDVSHHGQRPAPAGPRP